jgi:hypothetical protein
MGKVVAGFSMSLDGFVADADDGVDQVFKWYSAGGTDAGVMSGDNKFPTLSTCIWPEDASSGARIWLFGA